VDTNNKLDNISEDNLRQNFRRLELLYRLGAEIFEQKDENIIFSLILNALKKILPLERAIIATFTNGSMIPRVLENITLPHSVNAWPISKTMIEKVKKGETILTVDAKNDQDYKGTRSVKNLDLRSVLCCPIGSPKKPSGFIYIDNRIQKGVFSEDDVYFLKALSHYAFLSLNNSEIYQENRISKLREKDIQKKSKAEVEIIGESPEIINLLNHAKKIALTELPVLIVGETGTGKEILAKFIHYHSLRSEERFVPINVAGIHKDLLHSELFGHEKGAFTGAFEQRIGKIEYAKGGTFFLDEAQDMPPETQIVLLRVLEEYRFESLGSNNSKVADIRLVSAISKNPEELVENGSLRRDLYYRLNTGILRIPPLRERREDIPLLLDYFMNKFSCQKTIEKEAMDLLVAYRWPGNIRELIRVVQALNVFVSGKKIMTEDLPYEIRNIGSVTNHGFINLPESIRILERQKIIEALKLSRNKDNDAIKMLGVSRKKFYDMKKQYGLMKSDLDPDA
jgi:DNA-binding NtrC family response regulator